MKFKIGDKVIIKSWDELLVDYKLIDDGYAIREFHNNKCIMTYHPTITKLS